MPAAAATSATRKKAVSRKWKRFLPDPTYDLRLTTLDLRL
ncbi:MAG: hypothetical protein AVDCRST_MAG56-1051 [uncultured Cytophagales bacterium]|uniref:Uncharacterized protein n=1 Tax=uncultured Cytophagales bacterium TaxID=158755 RepID=A0A6J4HTD6_9SPHI|nr:MAG: hypothetical protein AVDCRST_MAG56-1051 [uncultured Cytophagales bacterium]